MNSEEFNLPAFHTLHLAISPSILHPPSLPSPPSLVSPYSSTQSVLRLLTRAVHPASSLCLCVFVSLSLCLSVSVSLSLCLSLQPSFLPFLFPFHNPYSFHPFSILFS